MELQISVHFGFIKYNKYIVSHRHTVENSIDRDPPFSKYDHSIT